MSEEIEVKGIIISTAPQGEYGRRIRMLTDKLGKITVFAKGAAKAKSRIIGATRPFTCAGFRLLRGRGDAYSICGTDIIDSFDELSFDFDASVYAMYVLETGEYFSAEGMPEEEAKQLLNLIYVSLDALRKGRLDHELIRSIYELRLLVLQGQYTLAPAHGSRDGTLRLWQNTLSAPLTALYSCTETDEADADEFRISVRQLFDRQTGHRFRALEVLKPAEVSDMAENANKAF